MFDRSKLESLRDVNVTKIGDTLFYGFPQTGLWKESFKEEPKNFTKFQTAVSKFQF